MNLDLLPDLPTFLSSLDSQRLLIIGNGPSASGQDLGEKINQFDRVIRINNFVTSGLESQIGSRTDIWVNGANQGLKRRRELPKNILVMIPSEVLTHKGDAIHDRIKRRLGTSDYFMLPLDLMSHMETSANIARPTTGFFSIYFFYLLGLNITLHGFDFFVGSKAHYFDGPLKRWLKESGIISKAKKHDINEEKWFVEDLIEKGQVKILKP